MSTDQLIQATMTDLTAAGSGFATLPDGKQIFLPGSVVRGSGANIGDLLTCKVVPNYDDRRTEAVPWRAFYVEKIRELDEMVVDLPEDTEQEIMNSLRTDGPATIGQLWTDLFDDRSDKATAYRQLATMVNELYRQGRVAKAQIYMPGTSKAKYTFFAASERDLMPTDDEALPDLS